MLVCPKLCLIENIMIVLWFNSNLQIGEKSLYNWHIGHSIAYSTWHFWALAESHSLSVGKSTDGRRVSGVIQASLTARNKCQVAPLHSALGVSFTLAPIKC